MNSWCTVLCAGVGAWLLFEAAPVVAQGADVDIHVAALSVENGRVRLGAARNVTQRAGYDNQPHFTLDGAAFLYTVIDSAGRADIWRHDIASVRSVRVTRTSPESEYSATPLRAGGFSVVRVERDSAQRLWRFDDDGSNARVLLEDVRPVGYHAWVDDDVVALYVLGSPPTLRLANVRTGAVDVHASDIGRSLQKIPGRRAISFVQRAPSGDSVQWLIRELDAATGTVRTIVPAPAERAGERMLTADAHAWTPGGVLLVSLGSRILAWDAGNGTWYEAAKLDGLLITRLAIGPAGDRIAFVAEPMSR